MSLEVLLEELLEELLEVELVVLPASRGAKRRVRILYYSSAEVVEKDFWSHKCAMSLLCRLSPFLIECWRCS